MDLQWADFSAGLLERVAARIAKGLFYHKRGFRLPDGYEMVSYSEYGKQYASKEVAERIRTRLLGPLWSAPENTIGSDVFSYRFLIANDEPNSSAWLLVFFNAVRFVCVSVRREPTTARPTGGGDSPAGAGVRLGSSDPREV